MKRVFIFLLFLTNAKQKRLSKKDLKLEKSARLQAKMALRYEKALRKSVKMERKLMKKQAERSIYPTMAKQVDFSLSKPKPYLQEIVPTAQRSIYFTIDRFQIVLNYF